MFCALFDQIEQVLPTTRRLGELKRLARLLEGLLAGHAAVEEDTVLLVLDRAPEHQRRCDSLHKEHHEIDSRITRVHATRKTVEARRLLAGAIIASRKHFQHEERIIFPFIERVAKPKVLANLGMVWMHRRHMPPNWPV